jgi:hypothetical protein
MPLRSIRSGILKVSRPYPARFYVDLTVSSWTKKVDTSEDLEFEFWKSQKVSNSWRSQNSSTLLQIFHFEVLRIGMQASQLFLASAVRISRDTDQASQLAVGPMEVL